MSRLNIKQFLTFITLINSGRSQRSFRGFCIILGVCMYITWHIFDFRQNCRIFNYLGLILHTEGIVCIGHYLVNFIYILLLLFTNLNILYKIFPLNSLGVANLLQGPGQFLFENFLQAFLLWQLAFLETVGAQVEHPLQWNSILVGVRENIVLTSVRSSLE